MVAMYWSQVRDLPRGRIIAIAGGALLLLALAGAALASRAQPANDPQAPTAQGPGDPTEAPPTAAELDRIVERLAAAGVTTNADTVAALAAEQGVGGAVRILWWSHQSGTSADDIVAMRTGDADTPPMGWGRIAKVLGVHPGIGAVMGGGHGRESAPG